MRKLVCKSQPEAHGGKLVFDSRGTHYCDECNCELIDPEEV